MFKLNKNNVTLMLSCIFVLVLVGLMFGLPEIYFLGGLAAVAGWCSFLAMGVEKK